MPPKDYAPCFLLNFLNMCTLQQEGYLFISLQMNESSADKTLAFLKLVANNKLLLSEKIIEIHLL